MNIFAYSKWGAFAVLCGRLHFGYVVTFLLVLPYAPWWFHSPCAVVASICQEAEVPVTEQFRNTPFTEALAKFERYSAQEAKSSLAPEVIGKGVYTVFKSGICYSTSR